VSAEPEAGPMRAATSIPRRRVLLWGAALLVLAALLLVGLAGKRGAGSRPAPALPTATLAGPPVTLHTLLAGHAALVVFWASWCEPCQHEAPAVERFAQSAAGRRHVVGVDYGESSLSGPRAFVRRYRWTMPVLLDPDARAGEAYGVTSLPNTFAIDARGRIVRTLRGPQTPQSLAQALAAASRS
jgi:cytochrome c biogenesis protein CcmG, thiol:disulfide interchange protein DsbE